MRTPGRDDEPGIASITRIYRDRGVTFDSLVAEDAAMREAIARAKRAARTDAHVLLVGETGTGKNLVAQAIHNASRRAGRPFVVANCAAFTESLLESELFGHERGAFTGAERARRGVFEQADGGTLFLDEIAELSPGAQAKLLRAVEYKEFERVGGERTLAVDLRLLFATHRDLDEAVAAGEFREDLLYRVRELVIEIPPLRRRPADVASLARRFLAESNAVFGTRFEGFTPAALERLRSYDWPGNARELRAVVRRACALADGVRIDVGHLEFHRPPESERPPDDLSAWRLATVERRHIERVLAHTRGNKSEAARILGIARTTLDRKIERHGIETDPTGRTPPPTSGAS